MNHNLHLDNSNPSYTLSQLGYSQNLEQYRTQENLQSFGLGRVIMEHKDRYIVKTATGDFDAEIIGNLRYTAQSRADFPAVGDWVAISEFDEQKVLIHKVFPRKTTLKRKAVGKYGEEQIIATNIDFAFIVQAIGRDFNLNRLERYLTICHEAGVEPIIVISKIDLASKSEVNTLLQNLKERVSGLNILAISNETQMGFDLLKERLWEGKTYCVMGSSGVGKSSLINSILGRSHLKTNTIGNKTNRGRHVTSHRELIVLETGGIIIDTPGMREIGMTDTSKGLSLTFDQITELAETCKYKDCTHVHEKNCAVKMAVENGELDQAMYENYLKLLREQEHYTATVAEKRQRDKKLGKLYKAMQKKKR